MEFLEAMFKGWTLLDSRSLCEFYRTRLARFSIQTGNHPIANVLLKEIFTS